MKLPIELKKKYLDRRLEDIKLLRLTLDQGDFSHALRVGHQVKGNAVTFEVPRLAPIGNEMETAAKRRDIEKLRILIQRMEVELMGVQVEI
jgi:HPt (histidine-containing phosphotransfer) domain-containing protein